MLDAIASAPFLPLPGEMAAEANVEPTQVATLEAPVSGIVTTAEHEIAATETEVAPVIAEPMPEPAPEPSSEPVSAAQPVSEPASEPASQPVATEETRRHALHGPIEEPTPAPEGAPRKFGWWNRKKVG